MGASNRGSARDPKGQLSFRLSELPKSNSHGAALQGESSETGELTALGIVSLALLKLELEKRTS